MLYRPVCSSVLARVSVACCRRSACPGFAPSPLVSQSSIGKTASGGGGPPAEAAVASANAKAATPRRIIAHIFLSLDLFAFRAFSGRRLDPPNARGDGKDPGQLEGEQPLADGAQPVAAAG